MKDQRGQKGQILIEFALLTPLVVLLLFAILDVGILLLHRGTLDFAVREGSQEAAAGVPAATVAAITAERSGGLLDAAGVEICAPDADHVRVSGTYTWAWLSGPLVARLGGGQLGSVTLKPAADRRVELDAGATPAAPTPDAPPCP